MFPDALAPLRAGVGRAQAAQALTSAGYLALGGSLAWTGLDARSGPWPGLAGVTVIAVGAALAWYLSHRRWHLVRDTPTARVRSAAQGYVELVGRATLLPGQSPPAFNGLPPCVWFEVLITDEGGVGERRSSWTRVSDEIFALTDDTGTCVIDPDDAEVHMAHVRRWRSGNRHYRARFLMQHDTLYAIGALETLRGADGELDSREDVPLTLREWKRDRSTLLRRFDANRDGDIDAVEWRQAVAEAERVVADRHRDLREHPDVHVMRAPGHGLPYVLSNRDPAILAWRFRAWSWFHAAAFFCAVAAAAWLRLR